MEHQAGGGERRREAGEEEREEGREREREREEEKRERLGEALAGSESSERVGGLDKCVPGAQSGIWMSHVCEAKLR